MTKKSLSFLILAATISLAPAALVLPAQTAGRDLPAKKIRTP